MKDFFKEYYANAVVHVQKHDIFLEHDFHSDY